MRINRRRALQALVAFIAWDPTRSRFIAEPTEYDWDAEFDESEPALPPTPPVVAPLAPRTLSELLARENR
jgi:hypothetical protein